MTDNIVPENYKNSESPKSTESTESPYDKILTPNEVLKVIAMATKHAANKIQMVTPQQLLDGCMVKFTDPASNNILATGRLRFRNKLSIAQDNQLYINVGITDLAFGETALIILST